MICDGFSVAEQENTRLEPPPFPPNNNNNIAREIRVVSEHELLSASLRPDATSRFFDGAD